MFVEHSHTKSCWGHGAKRRFAEFSARWSYIAVALAFVVALSATTRAQEEHPGPTEPELISLNLPEDMELKLLVALVSEQLGGRILYDEQLASKRVTIKAPAEIPKLSLRGVLESALKMKGLALIDAEEADWLRIVTAENLTRIAKSPLELPKDLSAALQQNRRSL